jgi:hypothetical membrane protein
MRRTAVGALLWMLCLQYFVAEGVAILGWRGSYSLARNFISDLGALRCDVDMKELSIIAGAVCSPLHAAMNASFLLQGLLIAGGAILARPMFPRGRLWLAGLVLIGAAGLGVFVVGLAPEDAAPRAHYAGAALNLISCNVGMAATGVAMLRWRRAARAMGFVALGAGAAGLAGLALLAARLDLGLGVGLIERLAAYPFPLWVAGMGALLLRRGGLLAGAAKAPPSLHVS